MKAIDSADVAIVMTDASEGYTAQDAHVVGYVLEAGKGVVLVLNKWDAVEKDEFTADRWLKQLRRDAPYLAWADIVFASALTGQRVERILGRRCASPRSATAACRPASSTAWSWMRCAPTRPRTSATGCRRSSTPPRWGSRRRRSSSSSTTRRSSTSRYRRYLENRIREKYGFLGTPIRLILRQRESEEAARRSSRPRRTANRRR